MSVLDPTFDTYRFMTQLLCDMSAIRDWLAGDKKTLTVDNMTTLEATQIIELLADFDDSAIMAARRAKGLRPETVLQAIESSPELRAAVMREICIE